MILEHNTYKEAVSDVKLSEEEGLEMVENAIRQKEQWSQRWKVQTAAVLAGIMVVVLSANGICFAATGMNAWDLFQSIYRKNSEEAEVISQNFQEAGDTLLYGNTLLTLENYWYDSENGMAYLTICRNSLDGSPLDEDEDAFRLIPRPNHSGSVEIGHAKPVVSEDKTSVRIYYHISLASFNGDGDSDVRWYPSVMAGGSPEALLVNIEARDARTDENEISLSSAYRSVGSFLLEPTPQMKMKSLDLDYTVLEECTGINITGGGLTIFFDNAYGEGHEKEYPFGMIELKMKDGASCYAVETLPEGDWEILSDDGTEITGYKSETMDISGDSYLGSFSSGAGSDYYNESGWESEYSCMFNRFIDLDDVAAVYVDGVEIPMK